MLMSDPVLLHFAVNDVIQKTFLTSSPAKGIRMLVCLPSLEAAAALCGETRHLIGFCGYVVIQYVNSVPSCVYSLPPSWLNCSRESVVNLIEPGLSI